MLRTLAAISRLSRLSPNIHTHLLPPTTVINNVRFKYQDRTGDGGDRSGRRKHPKASSLHDVDDTGDSMQANEDNLLDDK